MRTLTNSLSKDTTADLLVSAHFINEVKTMQKSEHNNWLINIENTAAEVAANVGQETVDFVLSKYGAKSIYALKSSDLSEVFSELYAIASDN